MAEGEGFSGASISVVVRLQYRATYGDAVLPLGNLGKEKGNSHVPLHARRVRKPTCLPGEIMYGETAQQGRCRSAHT